MKRLCTVLAALLLAVLTTPAQAAIRMPAILSDNMVWVKGHAETVENNRCDKLAVAAATGTDLPEDTGYRPE